MRWIVKAPYIRNSKVLIITVFNISMAEHAIHRGLMEYDRKTIAQFATEIGVSH